MSEYIVQTAEWAIDKNGNSLYQGCEEIVRCRDCEWFVQANPKTGWNHVCNNTGSKVVPDGYCAWGERREQ